MPRLITLQEVLGKQIFKSQLIVLKISSNQSQLGEAGDDYQNLVKRTLAWCSAIDSLVPTTDIQEERPAQLLQRQRSGRSDV
jgi:hypothetical protein